MKFPRLIALMMMFLLVGIPAVAQDGYPLLEDLPPITPENAAQVAEMARVGGVLPGDLVWSPDGSILAAGTSAGVKLYDADDLTADPRLISGGKDVLFNPAGTILVSGGQIWNARTGNAIASIGTSDTREFSPSGNILVTSRFEEGETRVFLWDARGKPLALLDTDSPLIFDGVVFNADETVVAIKLLSTVIQLWDVSTGQYIKSVESLYYDAWGAVSFSPSGRSLFAESFTTGYGSQFYQLTISSATESPEKTVIDQLFDPTWLSPEGTYALLDGASPSLMNLPSSQTTILHKNRLTFGSNQHPVFSPNEQWLAIAAHESKEVYEFYVALWKIRPDMLSTEPIALLEHPSQVNAFVFSQDSRLLAVHTSSQVYIWDTETQTQKMLIETSIRENGYDLTLNFDHDKQHLVIRNQNSVERWDITVNELAIYINIPTEATLNSGLTQAAYWKNGRVHVIDLETGVDSDLPTIPDYYGSAAAMNAVSEKVIFEGDGLRLFDLLTGTKVRPLNSDSHSVGFNPNGTQVITWNYISDRSFRTSTINLFKLIESELPAFTLEDTLVANENTTVFSPDGRLLAVNESEWDIGYIVRLYDTDTGKLLTAWRQKKEAQFAQMSFTTDGRYLTVSSYLMDDGCCLGGERLVSFWDVQAAIEQGTMLDRQEIDDGFKPVSILSLHAYDSGRTGAPIFSSDGEQMAIEMDDAMMGDGVSHGYRVYLVNTRAVLSSEGISNEEDVQPVILNNMYSPIFSPDGKLLLTATNSDIYAPTDTFDLWDTETGESVTIFAGDGTAAFSGDGALLATHGENGISLWEVASLVDDASPEPLIVLPDDDQAAVELAFSADNSRLYARWSGGVIVYGVQGG